MLREALERIIKEYPIESTKSITGNELANYIRDDFRDILLNAIDVTKTTSLIAKGSAGQGNWAEVPWGAIFDTLITDTATQGYYIVFLFSTDRKTVYLSLNQGTTAVKKEFGTQYLKVLRERAALMRARLQTFAEHFPLTEISLGSKSTLPLGYEAGHALGKSYTLGSIPENHSLEADLREIVSAYVTLSFRGGLEPSIEEASVEEEKFGGTLVEKRQYSFHRKIDRHPRASREAKRFHGLTCQACDMSFEATYGVLGAGFIEAHHLQPLSKLEEGKTARYNIASDFAVLCSNCHSMIHRMEDPSDLAGFRDLVQGIRRRSANEK